MSDRNFDQMMAVEEKSGDHQHYYPQDDLNVFTESSGTPIVVEIDESG